MRRPEVKGRWSGGADRGGEGEREGSARCDPAAPAAARRQGAGAPRGAGAASGRGGRARGPGALGPAATRRLGGRARARCAPPAGGAAPGLRAEFAGAGLVPRRGQGGLGAGSKWLFGAGHSPPPPPRAAGGGRPRAGGARDRPGLRGLRPRRASPPGPISPFVSLVLLSGLPRPLGPVFTSYSAWGAGRTRGRAGESPAAAPGSRPARTIGVLPAGEGRRRRCLQAWRGLCALRWWLSLSDCSKAAEKSAAVPLPVEAAAAAAEDAHWRSQGAPRRSRPRPRSAPRSYLAPRRQAPHPSGSRRPGCAPGPGRKTERRLGLARRPHIWAWC